MTGGSQAWAQRPANQARFRRGAFNCRTREVFYLPSYSPEINPDEYLNRDFKTELRTADRAASKKALLSKATTFMERLVKTPERVMAYFKQSAVQYAAFSAI